VAVQTGDTSPDFGLPDEQGADWRLSEQRGQPVVLIFHRHLA
jgi:peroxiredoxin